MSPKRAIVAVVGLGYVGLPLAVEFGKKFCTIGFDLSGRKIDASGRLAAVAGARRPEPRHRPRDRPAVRLARMATSRIDAVVGQVPPWRSVRGQPPRPGEHDRDRSDADVLKRCRRGGDVSASGLRALSPMNIYAVIAPRTLT